MENYALQEACMKMRIYKISKKAQSRAIYLIGIMLIIFAVFVIAEISINPYIPNPEAQKYKFSVDNGLKIEGEDWSARYSAHFIVSGVDYGWNDIPPSVQKDFWKKDISTPTQIKIKYGVDFSNVSINIKNNLQHVVLHLEETENITLADIEKEGNTIIIKNKVYISHDDILSTYSIPIINKTDIVIGNLNNIWEECINWNEIGDCIETQNNSNWKLNADGTYNISFDPTITIDIPTTILNSILNNVTAETNFTHLNIGSSDYPYDSLIGYWNFDGDEESAVAYSNITIYDWSKYNHDGIYYGDSVINNSDCIYGDCANFDGNGDYVSVPHSTSLEPLNELTYAAWIYPLKVDGANNVILQKNDENIASYMYKRFYIGYDKLNFAVYNGSTIIYASGSSITANTWSHVAVSVDEDAYVRIYINGIQVYENTTAIGDLLLTENEPLTIGAKLSTGSPSLYFNGSIDEVMIFNTSLTPTQISDIYNNQSARFVASGTQDLFIEGCYNDTGFVQNGYLCEQIITQAACDEQPAANCIWNTDTCYTLGGGTKTPDCSFFRSNATCEGEAEGDVCSWQFQDNIEQATNRVNISTTLANNIGSVINLSVGYHNISGWFYTEPQPLTSNTIHTFNISAPIDGLSDLWLNYTLIAGNETNPFYSPIIYGNISVDLWNEVSSTCTPPVSGNWDWNFEDNCSLTNMDYNINGYNITIYNSGIYTLENVSIIVSSFDLNSTGTWNIEAKRIKIVGS